MIKGSVRLLRHDVWLMSAGTAVARDGRVLVMKNPRAPLAGRGSWRALLGGQHMDHRVPDRSTNWFRNHQHAPARVPPTGRGTSSWFRNDQDDVLLLGDLERLEHRDGGSLVVLPGERARVGRGGGLRWGVPGVLAPHAAEGRAAARCQRRGARTCAPKGRRQAHPSASVSARPPRRPPPRPDQRASASSPSRGPRSYGVAGGAVGAAGAGSGAGVAGAGASGSMGGAGWRATFM